MKEANKKIGMEAYTTDIIDDWIKKYEKSINEEKNLGD